MEDADNDRNGRELQKFPRGERCPECGARRWYVESGFRYCQNGHQIEGFVQYEVERKEAEKDIHRTGGGTSGPQVKEKRHLSGIEATNLYVESLQLVLRNQVLWIVREKAVNDELETVVRDLWDLRTRGSRVMPEMDSASEGGLSLFSSQATSGSESQGSQGRLSNSTSRSVSQGSSRKYRRPETPVGKWDVESAHDWPLPRVLDSLALCYLSCLLLRLPVRIGDIVRWVNEEGMPWKKMWEILPMEVRERLPSVYTRLFKIPRNQNLAAIKVHGAVAALVQSYHLNYELVFPPLNHVLRMLQYVYELALPIEIVPVARRISELLHQNANLKVTPGTEYAWSVDKTKGPLANPEIRLIAVLVFSVKVCFPFDDKTRFLDDLPSFDWSVWTAAIASFTGRKEPTSEIKHHSRITAEELVAMTQEQLDDYFAKTAADFGQNELWTDAFFPVDEQPERGTWENDDIATFEETFDEIQSRAVGPPEAPTIDGEITTVKEKWPKLSIKSYKDIGDLPPHALAFFERAAYLAGTTASILVEAVYLLECYRLKQWRKNLWRRVHRAQAGEESADVGTSDDEESIKSEPTSD